MWHVPRSRAYTALRCEAEVASTPCARHLARYPSGRGGWRTDIGEPRVECRRLPGDCNVVGGRVQRRSLASSRVGIAMSGNNETRVIVVHQGSPGALAGALGAIFGLLGIFTIGILFVPIAAICSLLGIVRACSNPNAAGIGLSLLGCVMTVAGFVASPSLWLLVAAGSAAR